MELKEMKKEVEEVRNVKNESCAVVGDGSLVRLNKQRIRERRLSLPVNLITRPSSGISLLSSGKLPFRLILSRRLSDEGCYEYLQKRIC
jgi:hypothetical protein